MPPGLRKPMFATPEDAEAAFYEAIERADLEEMMSIWAEDEEIVCVHPGGPRLTGYAPVREAWRRVFENDRRLRVRVGDLTAVQGPFTAVHSVIEHVGVVGDESINAPVIATNVYVRGALGWRLLVHHASAAPPDSVPTTPKVLH